MSTARFRILRPLRHRDYRFLVGGALVSLFGDGVFIVALPLQVYALSNIPTAMAMVGLVWTGAQVSMLLVGGWASDHFERRRLMMAADVVRAVAMGVIGVLSVIGALALWHLLILGALVGASNAFFNPAASSIVPDLIPDSDLPQANAFFGTARPAMARLLGPAAGGAIVGAAGPGGAFLLDAVTFALSAVLLARMRNQPAAVELAADRSLASTLAGVREGLGFVRSHRWCWVWLVGALFGLLAYTGPVDMLLPFILRNEMGLTPSQAAYYLGAVLAFGGVGSITMSLLVGQLDLPRRFVTTMYLAEIVGVGMLAIYGFMTAVWQAILASLILNSMFAYADIAWITLLQRHVPRRLLGRVSSVDWLTSLGLLPLSFAVAGPLAATFGSRSVLIAGSLLGVLIIAGLMFVPGARDPQDADTEASPQPRALPLR
ncbi:MAG: MFS transporter [Actinomycetota bacterium]|nr:MFS transporter [Euzebyaceae bacterium]MDQ3451347.1 MFS transporter [Actinomycetota bacterium]